MYTLWKKSSGVWLAAIIAIPAWLIGEAFPIVGSPILGILFGMIIAFWKRPDFLNAGITFSSKKLLQYSIILLGFNMSLYTVFEVGASTIWLLLITVTVTFLTAFFVGKLLKLDANVKILIGVGTAICGGSAIAATAPAVKADSDEVAHAISTIFLFNVIAAFSFPLLGHMLQMSDYDFGLFAGTAINDTSAVVAAGYTFSAAAGDLAVIVKLTRTLLIIPITLFFAFYMARKMAGKQSGSNSSTESSYSIAQTFPWFILGFIAASLINTFLPIPLVLKDILLQSGKYMIVMAMVAIGLNTNLVKLVRSGWKPIVLGLSCWLALTITALILQLI